MGKSNPKPYTVRKDTYQRKFTCKYSGCNSVYSRKFNLKKHMLERHAVRAESSSYAANFSISNFEEESGIFEDNFDGMIEDNPEDESDIESDTQVVECSEDEDEDEDDEIIADIDNIVGNSWDDNMSEGNPFGNPQTMIIMCMYSGYSSLMSRSQLKTILYGINKIVELAVEATKDNRSFSMPTANMIMKATENKKYDGPSINTTTTEHIVQVKGHDITSRCTAILPSEHLQLSMANPKLCKFISALPDRIQGVSKGLTTGKKWTSHPLFQPPQINVHGKNFWVGDVVNLYGHMQLFLVKSFFCIDSTDVADGYFVLEDESCYGIIPELRVVPQQGMIGVVNKSNFSLNNCWTLIANTEDRRLTEEHADLLFSQSSSKAENPSKPGKFYKVVIAPIILFTDGTSGGSSKQHIPYESWSMVYAALSLEERGRRENTMFIGCAPKSDGVHAMHFIPGLSSNMKKLERGVLMYSSEYHDLVLVRAPLAFISVDNPAHSDVCGLMQQTTLYYCRKCYILKMNKKGLSLVDSGITAENLNQQYVLKNRNHHILAASSNDRKNVQIAGALPGGTATAHDLSFKNTGSQDLLILESFDPFLDTPVEALHCLPVGVAKYLIEHLVKVTLSGKANEHKMNRLVRELKDNEQNPSYSRNFRKHIRHVGSFVGRDFKQLIQVLPYIIAGKFTDPVDDRDIFLLNEPLKALCKLCSLVFVRQVNSDFDAYVEAIKNSVEELTVSLYEFNVNSENKKPFCTRAKVHYLHHLHEDIRRFGCALQFETEKAEMFNKFIREQLFHTNRHSPSRDVALRFGAQQLLKHVIDQGYWVNKKGKRAEYGRRIKEFVERDEKIFCLKFLVPGNLLKTIMIQSSLLQALISVGYTKISRQVLFLWALLD